MLSWPKDMYLAAESEATWRLGPMHPVTGSIMLRRSKLLSRIGERAEARRVLKKAGHVLNSFAREQGLNQSIDARAVPFRRK